MQNEFLYALGLTISRRNLDFQFNYKNSVPYALFFGVLGFIVSYVFSPYYIFGDQEFYREFYSGIIDYEDVSSAFEFYKNTIGASEPGYLLLTIIFSNFFDKDLIYAIVNGTFMGVSVFLILRRGVVLLIPVLLIFNFYFMTLFFSAERLKVAILVFEMGFLVKGFLRWVLLLCSAFFQFQMVIPILMYSIWVTYGVKKFTFKKLLIVIFLLSFPVASVLYFFNQLNFYILEKLTAYDDAGWGGALALLKPLIFMAVGLLYSDERKRLFFTLIPLIFAIYFFGSERFTIFSFMLMLFYASSINRGLNAPVLLSCIYFAIGGLYFLIEFLNNGAVGL